LEPLLTTAAGLFVRAVGFFAGSSSELLSSPLSLLSSLLLLLPAAAAGGLFEAIGFLEGSLIEQNVSRD